MLVKCIREYLNAEVNHTYLNSYSTVCLTNARSSDTGGTTIEVGLFLGQQ